MANTKPKCAFIANGAIEDYTSILPLIKAHDEVIVVDGGLVHCHAMKITPDMIFGDLDSISPELLKEYSSVPTRQFNCHKDQSDLELALQSCFRPEINRITVFGALGKRLDHTLSNLHLMRRYPEKVYFETEGELIFSFEGPIEIPCKPGQVISFMQLGEEVTGVTSHGLKWEMQDAIFGKYYYSLSNVCTGNTVKVSIVSGDLICILQK